MKKIFFIIAMMVSSLVMASPVVDLSSQEGEKRLLGCEYSNDYWVLNNYYLSQKPQSCGSGSAVMVLNALNIYRPSVEEYFGYTLFTPSKFLQGIEKVISEEEIKAGGMNLQVFAKSLQVFSLDATVIYADVLTAADFRTMLKKYLNDPQVFIVANYYRPAIGHQGKGNFSPIGAYDEATDSVLLLDALRDQYGPFWVQIDDLLKSMNEMDASGKVRGIVLVERQYVEVFSEKGRQMMKSSQFCNNYFQLSRYFETQAHWTYCGVASSVAIMNALLDQAKFSQENFFTEEVCKIVTPEEVKTDWRGLSPDELVQMLPIHGFSAVFTSADTLTVDAFREMLKVVLNDPRQFIIANYYRPQVGQVGGGHFSPVVAYDQESDSVLIMDTSRYKYTSVWIKLETFFNSVRTQDSSTGLFRGYLTVKKM